MDFLRISKSLNTIEDSSGNKIPRKIWGLGKKSPLSIAPLGTGRRRSGRILANRRPGLTGHGRGTAYGSLGLYSLARMGRREARWWPTVAHPSGSCSGLPSGEERRKAGRGVAAWASTDPRRGARGVGRPWLQEEAELAERRQWRLAAEQGGLVGASGRGGKGGVL
jgi:hypothetical protein